ncbi:histone lysine demethylase [Cyclospora cayetanensis]|uniref:Bifunctional lysine-specific demethylase and histidyl-hydroxylase n=1 Tax=Cyclospora cayetanensis TaxID=88456 RepID=A0A1D3D955_9EIME|nr:histone lysine demethylase [Cyclospora cayetanensis]
MALFYALEKQKEDLPAKMPYTRRDRIASHGYVLCILSKSLQCPTEAQATTGGGRRPRVLSPPTGASSDSHLPGNTNRFSTHPLMHQDAQLQQQEVEGARLADCFASQCLSDDFFNNTWERKHHIWRRDALKSHSIGPNLFNPSSFAELIYRVWMANNLALFKEGTAIEVGVPPSWPSGSRVEGPALAVWGCLLRPYLGTTSYILNQADRGSPMLYAFCRRLAEKLFYHVFAVGYLTPPKSYTVGAHTDAQDVFLLQLWGCKEWDIYNSPLGLCLSSEMLGKKGPIEQASDLGTPTSFCLNAGDILYIPRGMAHKGRTAEEISLHVTITIPTAEFSHETPRLAGGPETEKRRREMTKRLLEDVNKHLNYEGLLAACDDHAANLTAMQCSQYRVSQEAAVKLPIHWHSVVRLQDGISCECEEDSSTAIFTKGTAVLRLPICPTASAVMRVLAQGEPIEVAELPCADGFEAFCVCVVLLNKGLIQVERY